MIKSHITDKDPVHPLVAKTYKGYARKKVDKKITFRKDATRLDQLRSGHCLDLAHYKKRLDPGKSPTCPPCGEDEETVTHWMSCPATIRTRERIFGRADISPDTLTSQPEKILAFAEETLLQRG